MQFVINDVKLSFYFSDKSTPVSDPNHFKNNLILADLIAIAAMRNMVKESSENVYKL